MTINYSKAQLKKYMYSAAFLIILLGIVTLLLIKDKSLAVLMVCAPAILYLWIRTIVLFFRIVKHIKREHIFLECKDKDIYAYSIHGKRERIECSQIEYVTWDADRVHIYMKSGKNQHASSKLYKLLRYYLESDANDMTYPLWCESDKLKKLCTYMGVEHREKAEINKDEFVNLCSRYLVILVGVCAFFIWNTISRQSLKVAIIVLLVHTMIQFIMHKKNTVSICVDKVNMGLVLRCVMCSAFLAQYIFLACKVEEQFMHSDILGACSLKTGIVAVVIYLICWCFFMPQKALGKRMTHFMVERKYRGM